MDKALRKEIINFIGKTKSIIITAVKSDNTYACDIGAGAGRDCGSAGACIPIVKAVTKLGSDGLSRLYFSTAASSEFILAYDRNPAACAYVFDDDHSIPYPSSDENTTG
jgi:hypothetical protein